MVSFKRTHRIPNMIDELKIQKSRLPSLVGTGFVPTNTKRIIGPISPERRVCDDILLPSDGSRTVRQKNED